MSSGEESGAEHDESPPKLARDKRKGRPWNGTETTRFTRPIATDKDSVLEWYNHLPPKQGELSSSSMGAWAMELVLGSVWEAVEEKRLNVLTRRYAVRCAGDALLALVGWHNTVHAADEHPTVQREEDLRQWVLDEEATPCPFDTLVRGTINVRRSRPFSAAERTGGSNISGASRLTATTKKSTGGDKGVAKISDKPKAASRPPSAQPPLPERVEVSVEELEAREALAAHALLRQKKARLAQSDKDELAMFEKLAAEMKGREFFVAPSGAAVLVAQPDADKLPSRSVQPRCGVAVEEATGKKANKDATQRRKQVRDKPLPAEAFYTLLPPIQPPLYDSLQVEPGVLMKEGAREKRGDDGRADRRPTRKEYLASSTASIGARAAAVDGGFAAAPLRSGRDDHTQAGAGKRASASAPISTGPSDLAGGGPLAKRGAGLAGGGGGGGGGVEGGAAARPELSLPPDKPPPQGKPAALPDGGPAPSSQPSQVWDQPTRRSNLSEDSIEYRSPQKPDQKARETAAGLRSRMPRERPFMEKQRKHLPPPVYPGVQGHGFVTTYLAAENPLKPAPDHVVGDLSDRKHRTAAGHA